MKSRRLVWISLLLGAGSCAVYLALYLGMAGTWSIRLDIQRKWTCDLDTSNSVPDAIYFPNRGGDSGPSQIDHILEKCPEIEFDRDKETLFISKGRELRSLSIKPLYKWRLNKSWTYGYPVFGESIVPGNLYVYAIQRNDIGSSK